MAKFSTSLMSGISHLVDRFLETSAEPGRASIERDVSGRRRNQIGGKSVGASPMDGPDDLERLVGSTQLFKWARVGGIALPAHRGADI
jgi:hypothetical protein